MIDFRYNDMLSLIKISIAEWTCFAVRIRMYM